MMHLLRLLPLLTGLLLLTTQADAQPTTPSKDDLRPTLRNMTTNEKLKLLEYMRSLGASMDREIQSAYELFSQDKKDKVQMYIQLKTAGPEAEQVRTTVRWNRDTIFYGSIDEGTILIDSFKVTNTGKQPYLIRDVKSSCDCTVLKYPEYPVMPGETALIRVEFDSRGKAGTTVPGIIFYDNSTPNQRKTLYLKGKIQKKKTPGRVN